MTDLIQKIQKLKQENPKLRIGFVSGLFKIIHVGHIRLLRFAKETSDILVVAIAPDSDPTITQADYQDRLEAIESVNLVDYSTITPDLLAFLTELKPDFVVKGKEHENNFNHEQAILDQYGGQILFTAGSTSVSSSDVKLSPLPTTIPLNYPKDFCERHNIKTPNLANTVKSFSKLNVMVIGDIIIDEYISCDPLGMSQEDPTIVVTPIKHDKYLGGAGIVAAHAALLGANVEFFTVCGDDETAKYAETKLDEYNVNATLILDKTRPTSLKQRFRCKGKTMLRVSHLRQHAIAQEIVLKLESEMEKRLAKTDLLIFSDFNYGCLPQVFVNRLIEKAVKLGIKITADSQSSSQIGDVSRFTNTTLLTPTEREARLATKDFESGLVVLANKLMEKTKAENIVITLGEAGLLVQSEITDQIIALNPIAIDTSGAGDSFLVAASLALTVKPNIWEAVSIGSIVAAMQVSREGNIPLEKQTVLNQILKWKKV